MGESEFTATSSRQKGGRFMKQAQTTPFRAVVNVVGILAFGFLLNSGAAKADDPAVETDVFSIARGGQYYDK